MILSVIVLWFFVTGYDSIDTYRIYSQGYIDYATKDAYIRDGRLYVIKEQYLYLLRQQYL